MRRLATALVAAAVSVVSAISLGLAAPAHAQSLGSVGSSGSSELMAADSSECAPNIVVNIPGGANSYAFLPQNFPHGGNTREVGTGLRLANPGRVLDICRVGDIVCETSDAASHMAKSLAKTAVLTSNLNMVENVATFSAMTSHQRLIALPTLIAGWSTHNDYYSDGGPGIARAFMQQRLEG